VSAETSSSLADFQRAVLAIASDPSIDRIMLMDSNYQPIFNGEITAQESHSGELQQLKIQAQQAQKTGLSIGAIDPHDNNLYKIVSLIHISALPQENVLIPKPSLLVVSLHTQQARTEALVGSAWITLLFASIGVLAFITIYLLVNKLVLKPSQRIVKVMELQSYKNKIATGFKPEHELGLIGQTFDQLAETLNAREQALKLALLKAQEASTTKSQFLASMSHEIRTPMNGVIGMLNLLDNEPLTAKQKRYTQVAKSSADSLLNLINDILDVSKIEAGKLNIEMIDFDIHHLFSDFATSMSHRIQNPNLKLIVDIDDLQETIVQGDPGRIRQILTNLVGNAIKFTQQGSITVTAKLTPTLTEGDLNDELMLHCDIQDTGIGIAKDKLNQLFDLFTQADSSTTREYGGTGLGLSIVKQLCQLMRGDIEVSSEINRGSLFSFSILLQKSSTQLITDQSKDFTSKTPINVSFPTGSKILLAEDNKTNQLVALGILESLNLQVDIAEDGQQAIEMLKKHDSTYSVILMDCQMPVMDGFTTTHKIRSGEAGKEISDIPIIAMTANAMQGDRDKCLQAGMNGYVAKPINESVLFETLSHWLPPSEQLNAKDQLSINSQIIPSDDKSIASWDIESLKHRLGNQEQLIFKVLQTFQQDMPKLITQTERHLKQKDKEKLADMAHTLKGVTANIGATELQILSTRIELQNQADLWQEIENTWQDFKISYQRLIKKIEQQLPNI
jgi:signal transduction histidine kinase/CheY-like chemotaxis protein/HPt (histidine-containing phosphotransfer) domain-containing protein